MSQRREVLLGGRRVRLLLTPDERVLHALAGGERYERVVLPSEVSVCGACGLVLDAPQSFVCMGAPRCSLWSEDRPNVGSFVAAGLVALHSERS